MAHAPTPRPRPSSHPVADAAGPAAARPDDAGRAWAFLVRRAAWERRLDSLRRDVVTPPVAPVRHSEAA